MKIFASEFFFNSTINKLQILHKSVEWATRAKTPRSSQRNFTLIQKITTEAYLRKYGGKKNYAHGTACHSIISRQKKYLWL